MKVMLVEVIIRGYPRSAMYELRELSKSKGYEIAEEIFQRRNKPDPAYLIGKGKLYEIKRIVKEKNIRKIIFLNTLKASQAFRIRKEVGWDVDVIDRNILILEIFEERARTSEAKIQIELARLRYMLPWVKEYLRFRNIYGEQVGFGALGEYLHKIYEQRIMSKIRNLEKRLESIRSKGISTMMRRHEYNLPEVILTGYTQAGKTELFNSLTKERKTVGQGFFTTLSTCARKIEIGNGTKMILIDSIGFIENMHPIIINAFYATLYELTISDMILLIVDASEKEEEIERKLRTMQDIINRIAPITELLIVPNKIDLINEEKVNIVIKIIRQFFPYNDIVCVSAKKKINLELLIDKVVEKLRENGKVKKEVTLPAFHGF